jgi:uncharacterized protein (UPF0276 family)
MRQLGVGLVYWSALTPLFESGDAAVLELEPQTLWSKSGTSSGYSYRLNEPLFESIAELPQAKLMHGVGQPLGGTVDDPIDYVPLLRRMADRLQPAWVSEHLSFNRVHRGGRVTECGFLLPPRQTHAATRVAAANVRRYARALGRPVAFETGVNYFRQTVGDLDDGEFFNAVAEQADSGILLDLHNLWCNERNGRQRVVDALEQMPLDRVWEVHFAGGMALDGYWLDAHSHGIPAELLELAATIIPRLPSVGALIFEILPEHLSNIGIDGVHRQLESLRELWRLRSPRHLQVRQPTRDATKAPTLADIAEVRAWEVALAEGLHGRGEGLAAEPGAAVLRRLITDFRSASLTRGLRYTITALLAGAGVEPTRRLLDDYFRSSPPDAYAAVESLGFARFLGRKDVVERVPYLAEILGFETALLSATLFGETSEVRWTTDPTRLLEGLDAGRLPNDLPTMPSRMTIAA